MTFGEYREREYFFESQKAFEYHKTRLLMSAMYCGQVEKVPKLKDIIYIPLFDYQPEISQEELREYKKTMPTTSELIASWKREAIK